MQAVAVLDRGRIALAMYAALAATIVFAVGTGSAANDLLTVGVNPPALPIPTSAISEVTGATSALSPTSDGDDGSSSSSSTTSSYTRAHATRTGIKCLGCRLDEPSRLFSERSLGAPTQGDGDAAGVAKENTASPAPVVGGPLETTLTVPGFGLLVALVAGLFALARRRT